MVFYTANLLFGNTEVARQRHFKDVNSMNNRLIENWNSFVDPSDKVYILGGVGVFEFLLSLNGEKVLMFTNQELEFYNKYISSVTSDPDDIYNKEMFETYIKNIFYIHKTLFQKSIVLKDYSGKFIRLSTDTNITRNSTEFVVAGGMGNYQKMFSNGINADISVNGLFPLSEVEVRNSIQHLKNLI